MKQGLKFPALQQLSRYGVNIPDAKEVIYEPLYDIQTYPTTGQLSFTFFQSQIGVNGKTLSDTNLDSSGQVPKGKNFLVTGIEVNLYPAVTAINPASPDASFLLEVYSLLTARASLTFKIGSKEYHKGAPLMKFPPAQRLAADVAVGTAAANSTINYASATGQPMDIVPVRLTSNQNFDVKIQFENLIAVAAESRIGVTLRGYLFRNAQ